MSIRVNATQLMRPRERVKALRVTAAKLRAMADRAEQVAGYLDLLQDAPTPNANRPAERVARIVEVETIVASVWNIADFELDCLAKESGSEDNEEDAHGKP